jgi:hypothetical protein
MKMNKKKLKNHKNKFTFDLHNEHCLLLVLPFSLTPQNWLVLAVAAVVCVVAIIVCC